MNQRDIRQAKDSPNLQVLKKKKIHDTTNIDLKKKILGMLLEIT